MPITFLHTADWQIGKPFARIDDDHKRALTRQERLLVLQRLGAVARYGQAEFIVVAGDVFDSTTPDKATVSAACAAIGALELPVYVIPGNHDHGGPGSLWEQVFFQQECSKLAPNLQVLLRAEPVELENAVLLPCPLLRRQDASDTTAWLRGRDLGAYGGKPRIVIAHGSVQGFGPAPDDEDGHGTANQMDLSRLPTDQLDYAALGDWHGMKDVSMPGLTAWYAGTPEPDRFPRGAGNVPGQVLMVNVERGRSATVTPVSTTRLGWHDVEFALTDDSAVMRLEENLTSRFQGRTGQDLLRLTLSGSLGMAAWAELDRNLDTWRSRLLRLRLHARVIAAPTETEIQNLTRRTDAPLLARVAERLLNETHSSDFETAEAARQALRLLSSSLNS